MITVSTRQLVSAIEEAEAFRLPRMDEGTQYLYDELYRRLLNGSDLRLSMIDFSRFELDDIDSMREMHFAFESAESKARDLARTLRNIPAAAAASAFV